MQENKTFLENIVNYLNNSEDKVLLSGAGYWIYSVSSKVISLQKTAMNGVDSVTLEDSTKSYLSQGSLTL